MWKKKNSKGWLKLRDILKIHKLSLNKTQKIKNKEEKVIYKCIKAYIEHSSNSSSKANGKKIIL